MIRALAIDVFDEDLDGDPPFNVFLSSPSGGSVPVEVSSVGVGVVQYHGTALLGTDLVVSHGELLTVTYNDADTGSGSPGTKTDTAVLDCAGPVVSNVEVTSGLGSLTLSFDTDEAGTTDGRAYGNDAAVDPGRQPGSGNLRTRSSSTASTPARPTISRSTPPTRLATSLSTTAGGCFYGFTTGGEAGVVEDATDTPVAIPDNNPAGASSHITVDSAFPILDVDVLVNVYPHLHR